MTTLIDLLKEIDGDRFDAWKRISTDKSKQRKEKSMGQPCGRGWTGLRGACKRVKKGMSESERAAISKESKAELANKIRAIKSKLKKQSAEPVRTSPGQNSKQPASDQKPKSSWEGLLPTKDPYDANLSVRSALGTEREYAGVKQDVSNSRIFAIRESLRDWNHLGSGYQESYLDELINQMRGRPTYALPTDYALRANYDFQQLWDKTPQEARDRVIASNPDTHANPVVERALRSGVKA